MMIPCLFVLFSAQNFVAAGVRVSNSLYTDLRLLKRHSGKHRVPGRLSYRSRTRGLSNSPLG